MLVEMEASGKETDQAPVVIVVDQPSARINFSCVTVGTEAQPEMVLFGGETNNGKVVTFYRDLSARLLLPLAARPPINPPHPS